MVAPAEAALTRHGIPVDPTLRVLAVGTLVNRAGGGIVMTVLSLYLVRHLGFAVSAVGAAFAVAGAFAFLAQVPLGHLGDRRGPREVLSVLTLLSGVAALGFLVARSWWSVTLVLSLVFVTSQGANGVRNGYIARAAVGATGVRFKAYLRAVTNVAIGFGSALGGLALVIDRPWAYLLGLGLDAASSIAAGLISLRLPHLPPSPARGDSEPRMAVLHDLPFVTVTCLNAVVTLHFVAMELALPLWVSQRTQAPTALVAVLLIVNTIAVSLFQVRLSRGATTVTTSAGRFAVGGWFIAIGFAVIALSAGRGPVLAVACLLAGVGIHVVGEMIASAGQWGISMGLAPMERQGQYQGFSGLSFSVAAVVGPPLVTVLCVRWGWPGWLILGGLILTAALLTGPAARWALRTRQAYGATTASG